MKLESRTSSLQELYAEESARIQKRFEEVGDGKAAVRDRTALIDSVVTELWNEVTAASGPIEGFCVAAMGGYGRRGLFPYSDIDLLFLYAREGNEEFLSKKAIAPLSQSLWDLHLRVSPTTRTLAECGKLYRNNIEFNISLLDCRYICGDEKLYERLRTRVLPGDGDSRVRNLDAGTHRPGPRAASEIRPNDFSPRTQHQGRSRRPARLSSGLLALANRGDEAFPRMERPRALAAAPAPRGRRERDRFPRCRPVLPALSPGPRPQRADLRDAVGSGGQGHRPSWRPGGVSQ